jgi:hypothetical protein
MKKIIIIGIIILIAEIIFGIIYLSNSYKSKASPEEPAPKSTLISLPSPTSTSSSASFKIISPKTTFKKGETIALTIDIDTDNKSTTAADMVLQYDPVFLKPVKVTSPFEKGTAYEKLVFNALDPKLGIATTSAISEVNKNFSGEGSLVSISFTALKAGSSEVIVKYSPNATTDSNIVSEGKDILAKVENLKLEILP